MKRIIVSKNTTTIEKYELKNSEKCYHFQIYVEIDPLTYKTFQLQKKSNRSSYAFLILIETKKVPKHLNLKDFDTH